MPVMPDNPSGGARQQRAAQLREEQERAQRLAAPASAPASSATSEESAPAESLQPAGAGNHVVKQGECMSSIAKDTGHFWETLWTDPGNAALHEGGREPNVLFPGDRVVIPEKQEKKESGATEQRHTFKRKGEPTFLRLRLLDQDEPRANVAYTLLLGGERRDGHTDLEGFLQEPIPGGVRRAVLKVEEESYDLQLGGLDPIQSVSGVQQRLNNLGFPCGKVDGIFGPRTRSAMNAFQKSVNITPTRDINDETRAALEREHDDMRHGVGAAKEAPPGPEDSLEEGGLDDPLAPEDESEAI